MCHSSNTNQLEIQAYGYFKMCGVNADGIYAYFTQNVFNPEEKDKVHNGFLYTIKKILGDPMSSDLLQQNVPNPMYTDTNEQTTLAIEFFSMFKKFLPNELASIALKSQKFLGAVNNQLMDYLMEKKEKS